jgi:hypothetical protein
MKKNSISLLLFLFTLNCVAQKVNRESFEYRHTHIPEKLIYDQIKTYGVNVNVIPSSGYNLDYDFANNIVGGFSSYSKVAYEIADMQVRVNYGPFQTIEEKTISWAATEEINGIKTSVTKYKRKLTYKFPLNYTISNRKNGVKFLYNELSDPVGGRYVESAEAKTELEAVNSFTQNKQVLLQNEINNMLQSFCTGTSTAARDLYDFYPTMGYGAIFKFKKWAFADEYNDHVKHVISSFGTMTADDNETFFLQKISGDINYFKQFEGKFKPEDKDEDILYFGNYFNLASIYTCVDEYEKASYYLQKLDSSKKEKGITTNLKNNLENFKRRTAKHFLSNTHLTYNPVSDYRLTDKKFVSDAKSSTELVAQSLAGGALTTIDELITVEGKVQKGKIFVEKETGQLKMIMQENKESPIVLTPSNCISFKIDSINYFVAKETVGGVFQKCFYKIEYQSTKIKLLQMVRADLGEIKDYLSIIRANEEVATPVVGISMKKKLSKYFSDCTIVSDKAKNGDYSFGIFNTSIKTAKFIEMCKEYTMCR